MRPIDADATIVVLERAGLELGVRGRIEEAANYFIAARILRESAILKPIEAEPVVHCKGCKYSKKFNITGNRYCDFHGSYEYPVSDDDYCSNGEKMDLEVE